MRLSRWLVVGVVVSLGLHISSSMATGANAFKMDFFGQSAPRHLGDVQVGDVNSGGFNLYVDDPRTHSRVLGLEVRQYTNALPGSVGLVLPIQEYALGMNVPASRRCGLRVAMSQQTFMNDKPFASFGLYPYHVWDHGQLEVGVERDQQNSDFIFSQGRLTLASGSLMYGVSSEYYEEQRAKLLKYRYERIGGGYLIENTRARLLVLVGSNLNWETGRPTWVGGFSRFAADSNSALTPGLLVASRYKPESNYTLAILTFGGHSINRHSAPGIYEAFFRGGLKHSRIIGGRNFDTPGVGSGYETMDFGTVAVAASLMSVEAGTATLISRDVSGYGTWPGAIGPLVNPFVGATWTEFSDLIYDPVRHRLDDPAQEHWVAKIGGKIRLAEDVDSQKRLGYLRVTVEVNSNGGMSGKCTLWF